MGADGAAGVGEGEAVFVGSEVAFSGDTTATGTGGGGEESFGSSATFT